MYLYPNMISVSYRILYWEVVNVHKLSHFYNHNHVTDLNIIFHGILGTFMY